MINPIKRLFGYKEQNPTEEAMKESRNKYMKETQDNSQKPVGSIYKDEKLKDNKKFNKHVEELKTGNYKFLESNMKFMKYDSEIIDLQHKLKNGAIVPEDLSEEQINDLIFVYKEQIKYIDIEIERLKKQKEDS